jgi:hypothetical protein
MQNAAIMEKVITTMKKATAVEATVAEAAAATNI